ncbi:leukocyte cell-derived chemotaxin-2-like [Latimeria chalumnae]|uniref:leukocyte cell-derived chemotaxin-2-like n=1 Tax=Latimeria chalumnae TaxID=7897 RepID=UPI00313B4384
MTGLVTEAKWGPLCKGTSSNEIRSCDTYGCGYYGASRNGVKGAHKGVDVKCSDGSVVNAPFDGNIKRKSVPYKKNNAINNGILVEGGGFCVKIWYIKPDRTIGEVKKGQQLGVLLPMQKVYPGITSHVHIEMCDQSDPTEYL